MKNLKAVIISLAAVLTLTGCGEKNEEYFLKNIDAAHKKIDECNKALEKAFTAKDRDTFEKAGKNIECQAAISAVQKDKRLKYELEQKRKEAEKKEAIQSELTAIRKQLNSLSWNDSINEYLKVEDCNRSFSLTRSPKCEAWKTVYDEQVDKGKKDLKQLSFDDLKIKMQSFCKLDKRMGSNCAVAQKALEEKANDELASADIQTIESEKSKYCASDIENLSVCYNSWHAAWKNKGDEFVKRYTENNAEFITTYNSCVDKLKEVDAQKLKWNEKNKLTRSIREGYPCSQVREAYSKRGMGYSNFNKKIEE